MGYGVQENDQLEKAEMSSPLRYSPVEKKNI